MKYGQGILIVVVVTLLIFIGAIIGMFVGAILIPMMFIDSFLTPKSEKTTSHIDPEVIDQI